MLGGLTDRSDPTWTKDKTWNTDYQRGARLGRHTRRPDDATQVHVSSMTHHYRHLPRAGRGNTAIQSLSQSPNYSVPSVFARWRRPGLLRR